MAHFSNFFKKLKKLKDKKFGFQYFILTFYYRGAIHLFCIGYGEMAELADGARLESVCTLTGTGGSNPPLSAIFVPQTDLFSIFLPCKLERNLWPI